MLARVGVTAFADLARAVDCLRQDSDDPFQVDAGIGLRLKAPGREGTLRIDYARGLRDGRTALTIGWQR